MCNCTAGSAVTLNLYELLPHSDIVAEVVLELEKADKKEDFAAKVEEPEPEKKAIERRMAGVVGDVLNERGRECIVDVKDVGEEKGFPLLETLLQFGDMLSDLLAGCST